MVKKKSTRARRAPATDGDGHGSQSGDVACGGDAPDAISTPDADTGTCNSPRQSAGKQESCAATPQATASNAALRGQGRETDAAMDVHTTCTAFGGVFDSWEEMESAFNSYQQETFQMYKPRTTNSIKDRNRSRIQQAAKRGSKPNLWDESLRYYTKTWNCTHGRKFQSAGSGVRTNHTTRWIDCPAKLNALLFQDVDGEFRVRVKAHDPTHCHKVDGNVFNTYVETRKVTSPATRSVVRTMWQGGAKRKKILRYLKEVSGKPILLQDVNNMIAEMRRDSYTSPDDSIRVRELLQDFSEGPGNVVNVFRDMETQLTSCITFHTCHMRRMTRLFPEVMCVDATHGTNINSFMLTDKFGSGSFAQHALIDGESRQNMVNAISAFKKNNRCWNDVKVIVVDKDFTEISTLEEEFPEASVILCHFHVIDYLKRQVSKRDYGFSSFEKLHLKNFLTMMVRASSEASFDHYLDAVKELCEGKPAFMEYLSANWMTCKERWCTFLRGHIPHLDDNTNNRLEASWGAAKDVLMRHMPMDECIETLLFLQQSAEDNYTYKKTRVGHRVNHQYDQEMKMLARIATHHACDLVEEQYKASQNVEYLEKTSGPPRHSERSRARPPG